MPHTHIQSHTITKNHKTSQTFTTFIHKHTKYSQQITIHHTSWDAIIQTHKTSQYSQKITGGSQKITPIYIYIYIYTHSYRKKNSNDDDHHSILYTHLCPHLRWPIQKNSKH